MNDAKRNGNGNRKSANETNTRHDEMEMQSGKTKKTGARTLVLVDPAKGIRVALLGIMAPTTATPRVIALRHGRSPHTHTLFEELLLRPAVLEPHLRLPLVHTKLLGELLALDRRRRSLLGKHPLQERELLRAHTRALALPCDGVHVAGVCAVAATAASSDPAASTERPVPAEAPAYTCAGASDGRSRRARG